MLSSRWKQLLRYQIFQGNDSHQRSHFLPGDRPGGIVKHELDPSRGGSKSNHPTSRGHCAPPCPGLNLFLDSQKS